MHLPRVLLKVVALALLFGSGGALSADTAALMPMPSSISPRPGALALSGVWAVKWSKCQGPALQRAFQRFEADYSKLTGIGRTQRSAVPISISCKVAGDSIDAMQAESYGLDVSKDGVQIEANGPAGVLRALATLRQLISLRTGQPQIAFVSIDDTPRFAWRGLMLDPARHFLEMATVQRQIDAMERVKLNVLHLHLSDDQGFRVESKRFPKLTSIASRGQYYTQEQIRQLVTYAADRGILIVPEFDVPGHSRALIEAYPHIGVTATRSRPPFPADVALNPAVEDTYAFLRELFEEMAPLFPGPYFHFGADEISDAAWADNAAIAAWMERHKLKSKHDVEGYFARRMIDILRALGKTPIGWEEFATTDMPRDAIVQAWQSSNATAAATAKGHRTIVSAGYYLDLLMPTDFHYDFDPLASSAAGFTPEQAERIRKMHPMFTQLLPDAKIARPLPPLTKEQQQLVLGAEAALWGEIVTDEMLDHRIWPRAAALAERFWSPATVRDVPDMYRRLSVVHDQLTMTGLLGDANRRRMAARLAPGDVAPVRTLLDIVSPVRNMAHDHRILAAARGQQIEQPLNALADAASADSLVARQFEEAVRRFIAGDASQESVLRAQLSTWRDNDSRFSALARDNAMLEPALATSANIAALARAGLDAIDAIRRTGASGKSWDIEEKLLAEAEAHDNASRLPIASFLGKHPPADLIIAITPGIRALVDEAKRTAPPRAVQSVGMVDQPCPAQLPIPDSVRDFNNAFLDPGPPNLPRLLALSQRPEFVAYNDAKKARDAQDWAGLCRYRVDNEAVIASGQRPDAVFLGDSITENWVNGDPTLFNAKRLGRGIGGQTTAQMLVRFRADVVALKPRTVHIMAGTNDVAGNGGPTTERAFQDNIRAMVEIARTNGIRVVLASIPPAAKFIWRPEIKPAAQIVRLNAWLREFAARERLQFIDYHSVLATSEGAMKPTFAIDGVHPNRDGYAAMRALASSVR